MNRSDKSTLPGFPWRGQFKTKDEIDQYFSDPDGFQCLLCGRYFEFLSVHLWNSHDISHEQYRDWYELPFRKKLMDTYSALPYAVQAQARMFSPQFYEDLKRLKAKGLPNTEIGRQLGISNKTVKIRLDYISKKESIR